MVEGETDDTMVDRGRGKSSLKERKYLRLLGGYGAFEHLPSRGEIGRRRGR